MADLDDFFAKKDRKKSKTVKKFSTAEEVAKKLDDPKQKVESRPKRDRTQDGEDGTRRGEEDEWREYEETIKDYTGLKIQHLQGGAAAGGATGGGGTGGGSSGEQGGEDDGEDSSEGTNRQPTKQKGPWNKSQADGASEQQQQQQQKAPPPPPPREAPPKTDQYVLPQMRNRQPEMERRPLNRRQARHAPDIHNADNFPQLGASAKNHAIGGGWSTAGGGANSAPPTATPQRVSTGNRFTQLTNDS